MRIPTAFAVLILAAIAAAQSKPHHNVAAMEPEPGAKGVSPYGRVALRLKKQMNPKDLEAGFATILLMRLGPQSKVIPGKASYDETEKALVFRSDEPLEPNTPYIAAAKIDDTASDLKISEEWRFETGAAPDLDALVAELKNPAKRGRATAEIEAAGPFAAAPLKRAIEKEKDETDLALLRALLTKAAPEPAVKEWPEPGPAHNGLRLTLALSKKRLAGDEPISGHVRITNRAKTASGVNLAIESATYEVAPDAAAQVRLVAIDREGHHRALGFFIRESRDAGARRYVHKVEPGDTVVPIKEKAETMILGRKPERLPPGEYRVYAILGVPAGTTTDAQPPELRSNEVTIEIG